MTIVFYEQKMNHTALNYPSTMNAYIEVTLCTISFVMCMMFVLSSQNDRLMQVYLFACICAPMSIKTEFRNPIIDAASWIVAVAVAMSFLNSYTREAINCALSGYSDMMTEDQQIALIKHNRIAILILHIPFVIASAGGILALRRANYVAISIAMQMLMSVGQLRIE